MRRLAIVAACLYMLGNVSSCFAQSNGIPMGFLAQTFYLKNGNSTGSCFAVDYRGKKYLITARHVVEGLPAKNAKLQVYRSAEWKEFSANIILPANKDIDIAVLTSEQLGIASAWNPDLTINSPALGGQVYFVGYPFGLHSLFNNGEYLPLVKVGVLSGLDNAQSDDAVYYIDGFNNPGFSGGPVIYNDNVKHEWHIFAVVKGYVNDVIKAKVKGKDIDTALLVNSGILLAYPIDYALKAIDANEGK